MRFASLLVLAVAMSTGASHAAPISVPSSAGDDPSLNSPFNVVSHMQIPGKTLKPGNYTITIKDHLSDRLILQVTNSRGKVESTFLGVFRNSLAAARTQGPIPVSNDKPSDALLGFVFPGGRMVEFVYPKAEAAALTSKTEREILAIDPESDNLKTPGIGLSKEDAAIVTLWTLQVAPVSGGQKGISAKKYEASSDNQQVATADTNTPRPAKQSVPPPQAQAASNRRPAIQALPHTASDMPLLLLYAAGSMSVAVALRMKRSIGDAK
jgi:hypothetical protein